MKHDGSRQRGASAVEYGLLIAGIAAVIAVAVFGFGSTIQSALFDSTCVKINSAIHSSTGC
ncbi:hypothetical protein JCM18899A_17340 [Nocardioides sp. AN3]